VVNWIKSHRWIVAASAGGAIVLIVVVAVLVSAITSGGSGQKVAPGTLVGNGPLTSGYRLTGKLKHHTADTIVVDITAVTAASADARNVVLRVGVEQEFDRPADGTVQFARNNSIVSSPAAFHDGDTVTVLGEFTSVNVPPGPAHDGYAFISVEASSG
jgi:hypothetical protein